VSSSCSNFSMKIEGRPERGFCLKLSQPLQGKVF